MSSNRGNQGNWRDGARGNRGQFQGSGGRGAGGGRGQFSGEDRDRGGGRGGRGNDGHRGAGGSRGQSYGENRGRGGGRGGYGHFQDDGNHGAGSSRGQSYGEDRSRGGGRGGYGHFQDDGNRGAGGSGSQSYGGGRGRSEGRSDYRGRGEGRSDYRGRGEGRGRGSRGRGGAGGGNFEPAEVVVKLPSYGALKEDLKEYPIDDKELEIPKRIRKPDMKPNPRYFQKEMFTVEVNYVSITFTNPENTRVFHYDVKILPAASKATYRAVMEEMRTRYYVTRYPAFDGERNLYAAGSELSFENNRCSTEGNPITITNDGKTTNFDVEITLVDSDLNMANLDKYIKEGTSLNRPKEMQALEIALKGNLPMRLLQVGKRAFYPKEGNFRALSVGTELRHGLFQGFVMGKEKYLNVDVAHKGFPIAQGVLDYLQAKIGSLPPQLSPNQQDGLGRYLKGLKIHYKNPIDRILSYKNGRLTSKDCDGTTFTKDDGSSISVYQYFVERYNYRIQHRRLPLLDTGNVSKDKHVYLPLELCSIAPNQAVMKAYTPEETEIMVRECSDKPDGRKGKVLDNVSGFADLDVIIDIRNANYASDDVLSKEFGIAVGTELLQVEAVVLKPPEMKYNNDVKSVVRNGVWRPEKFRTSRQLAKWVILVKEDGYKNNDVTTFFTETFRGKGRELNLTIEPPLETKWSAGSSKEEIKEDFSNLKKTHGELQLIVVVLPSNKSTVSAVYGHVKCVSELNEGILTQCVKWDTLKKMWNRPDNAGMTASNILLKVNAKLGGINYVFRDNIVDNDTMFMGADVTHPGIGSTNPSIATVIGSYNHTAFQYGMVYSVQESRCEPIVKMEDHAKALLKLYQKENKKFPSKIYYYRDGVSEGQFGEMKRTELMAIKEAGKQLNIPNLQVTFLVAQKRHHTRLFPMGNAGDKNGNVVAGTVINRTITHPTEHDFFLVSHQSIQGTARPTKYHAIHNEIGTSEDEIEMLTFHLCHLFARCTRSVKYPAPTYYAHLAGKRTEHYVKGTVNEEAKIINLLANGRVHPDMAARNPMHFI